MDGTSPTFYGAGTGHRASDTRKDATPLASHGPRKGARRLLVALALVLCVPLGGCEWLTGATIKNPDTVSGEPRMNEEQFRDWYERSKERDKAAAERALEDAKAKAEADAARVKREAEQDAETERLRLEAERRAFENAVAGIEGECEIEIRKQVAGFANLSDQVGAAIRRIEAKGVEGLELVNRKHAEAMREADKARQESMDKNAASYAAGIAELERKNAGFALADGVVRGLTENPAVNLVPWGGTAALAVTNVWQALTAARRRREDEKKAADAKLEAEKRVAQERIERAEAMREAERRVREAENAAWEESAAAHEKAVEKRDAHYVEGAGTARADVVSAALMQILGAIVPPGTRTAGGG